MFTTLEGKGILRTAVEEFLLASEYRPDDELAQEFTRTFRHTYFFGRRYVDTFDALIQKKQVTFEAVLRRNLRDTPGNRHDDSLRLPWE